MPASPSPKPAWSPTPPSAGRLSPPSSWLGLCTCLFISDLQIQSAYLAATWYYNLWVDWGSIMIHIKSSISSFHQMTSLVSPPPWVLLLIFLNLNLNRTLPVWPPRLNNLPRLPSSLPNPTALADLHHNRGCCQLLPTNGHRFAWLQLMIVPRPKLGNSCKEVIVNDRSSFSGLLPANRWRAGWWDQELLLKRRWRQEDVACTGGSAHAKPINVNCVPPNNWGIHWCLCCCCQTPTAEVNSYPEQTFAIYFYLNVTFTFEKCGCSRT